MSFTANAGRHQAFWDVISADYQQWYDRTEIDESKRYWNWPAYYEDDLPVLGDVTGKDVLELACGAAQWSRLLAKREARPIRLDISVKLLNMLVNRFAGTMSTARSSTPEPN